MTALPRTAPQQPMSAQQPSGAQIPLDGFQLPNFPPNAQSLVALTLTSIMKKPEDPQYKPEDVALRPVTVPQTLPKGIQSLTLEEFELGFADEFLSKIAEHLQELKSVVLYKCTLGLSKDEEKFFTGSKGLRALHLLDVGIVKRGFVEEISKSFRSRTERGLMFLEVGFTYEPKDDDEVRSLNEDLAKELPNLICPSLITVKLNVQLPDAPKSDQTSASESSRPAPSAMIEVYDQSHSTGLVDALTAESTRPRPLKALNITLYTITAAQLKEILSHHKGLMILNVTIQIPDSDEDLDEVKDTLIAAISQCPELEQLEIVGSPVAKESAGDENQRKALLQRIDFEVDQLRKMSKSCGKLIECKVNVLRGTGSGSREWHKRGGQWIG